MYNCKTNVSARFFVCVFQNVNLFYGRNIENVENMKNYLKNAGTIYIFWNFIVLYCIFSNVLLIQLFTLYDAHNKYKTQIHANTRTVLHRCVWCVLSVRRGSACIISLRLFASCCCIQPPLRSRWMWSCLYVHTILYILWSVKLRSIRQMPTTAPFYDCNTLTT